MRAKESTIELNAAETLARSVCPVGFAILWSIVDSRQFAIGAALARTVGHAINGLDDCVFDVHFAVTTDA